MITGKERDCTKVASDGYVEYTALSLYPSNGGFLKKHVDGSPCAYKDEDLIHFKIELTKKGVDYSDGGFRVKDRRGIMIDISSMVEPCDLVIF